MSTERITVCNNCPVTGRFIVSIDAGDWQQLREMAQRLKESERFPVGVRVVFERIIYGHTPKARNESGRFTAISEADMLDPNSGPFVYVIDAAERFAELTKTNPKDRSAPPTGDTAFLDDFRKAWKLVDDVLSKRTVVIA